MLRVSQKTEYAMRAMLDLAIRRGRDGDQLVPARSIAQSQQIPLRFLEQQLGALHKAGLVESFRGAGGGCRLAKQPSAITVAEIVDAIEGAKPAMHCLDVEDRSCFADSQCGLQELWGDVDSAVRRVLETTSLAILAERHAHRVGRPIFAPSELLRPRV
jgi:Rrf2 family transcriptional regulator, cysteine metabolism repressor